MSKRFPKPFEWKPTNPNKYIGKKPIISRSSWETRLFSFLDKNPSVIFWNSEDVIVKYKSPVDGRLHNYHVDIVAKIRNRIGEEKIYAIEIKPASQMVPPRQTAKKQQRVFLEETETFLINQAKWEAATEFFNSRGVTFLVLNEYDIGIAKRK